jgi:hypothetical protein
MGQMTKYSHEKLSTFDTGRDAENPARTTVYLLAASEFPPAAIFYTSLFENSSAYETAQSMLGESGEGHNR